MKRARLPNAGRAVVDIAKLRDYCLNPHHQDGKHKARVFASVLGVHRGDADWLRERLLEAAATAPAVTTADTPFGTLYVVNFFVDDPVGFGGGSERLDRPLLRRLPPSGNLLRQREANVIKPLLALVALTEDIPDHSLTRGQIGTVVEHLERDSQQALLVEFSNDNGQTYAMIPVRPDQSCSSTAKQKPLDTTNQRLLNALQPVPPDPIPPLFHSQFLHSFSPCFSQRPLVLSSW